MNTKAFFSKYGAYLTAAVLFITAAIIYCFPVTQGKVIYAGDNITAAGAVQESIEFTKTTGEHSWWNSSMFSGMPNYQIGGGQYKSSKWVAPIKKIVHRGHSHTTWVFILYFFCFFILMRAFDVDKWASIAGAFATALSSYFIVIIAAGHNGKTSTIALISLVLAGFYLIFRKRYGLGFVLAMICTAVGYSPHPQMAYYIFMLIGLLWFAELWIHAREKRMKDFAIASVLFFAAVGIGFGTTCANVFANAEYVSQTQRGGHSDITADSDADGAKANGLDLQYATQWSYGVDECFSFLIPGILGGASGVDVGTDSDLYRALTKNGVDARTAKGFCSNVPMYWGEQPFTSGNVYMGAIVCFLFVLGLLITTGPYKWALLIATLLSAALALGHNCMWLTEFFFKYFPLYSKFRAVSSILIVAEITMPLLGFLAIKELMKAGRDKKETSRKILISGAITGGICLIFWLFGGAIFSFTSSYDASYVKQLPDWVYNAIVDERRDLLRSDSLRSFIFIALACLSLLAYNKGKIRDLSLAAILGVLILCDMWPVDKRYLNDNNFVSKKQGNEVFNMLPYEEAILKDPSHFRVYNLTVSPFNDSRTSYRLKSIGGYCAAKLRRYQDLIDEHLSQGHLPVIGMLNAKYIITSDGQGNATPQVNPYALGNAWFVDTLITAQNAKEESDALMQIDLATKAVVGKDMVEHVGNLTPGIAEDASIVLTGHSPKSLDYSVQTSKPGVVLFSEIYYPFGWKASIDGEPVEHFRADYLLRAMNVPAGQHEIHFVFDPDSVRKGDSISMVFVILMYLLTFAIIAMAVRKRIKSQRVSS